MNAGSCCNPVAAHSKLAHSLAAGLALPQFVGMLESAADGIGVWRAAGGSTTVVTQVPACRPALLAMPPEHAHLRDLCPFNSNQKHSSLLCRHCQVGNQNFAPFARLCAGEFGGAVLERQHTLVAVNPSWTASRDIGQLWDRRLRQQAVALIDGPAAWLPLYHLWDVRTARGATGLLFRAWPHAWQLYSTCGEEEPAAALDSPPILVSAERPAVQQQIEALNAALVEQQRQQQGRPWWRK